MFSKEDITIILSVTRKITKLGAPTSTKIPCGGITEKKKQKYNKIGRGKPLPILHFINIRLMLSSLPPGSGRGGRHKSLGRKDDYQCAECNNDNLNYGVLVCGGDLNLYKLALESAVLAHFLYDNSLFIGIVHKGVRLHITLGLATLLTGLGSVAVSSLPGVRYSGIYLCLRYKHKVTYRTLFSCGLTV